MRSVTGSVAGLTAAIILWYGLAAASHFALSHERAVQVITQAVAAGQFPYLEKEREDYFTECSLIGLQYARRHSVVQDLADSRLLGVSAGTHPCDVLTAIANGGSIPTPYSYFDYPMGGRFVEAMAFSVIDFGTAQAVYMALSYGSVASLLFAAFYSDRRRGWLVVPIAAYLVGAFSMHKFGHNLAHAPGFFIGFILLAIFLMAKQTFTDRGHRYFFYGALGITTFYFDLMNAVIPTILSLTILLRQLFYGDGRWRNVITESIGIFLCFVLAYVALNALRLGVLTLYGLDWRDYLPRLAGRLGSSSPELGGLNLTFGDVAKQIWAFRYQLVPGTVYDQNPLAGRAAPVLLSGMAAWVAALAMLTVARRSRRLLADLFVTLCAGVGAISWIVVFSGHAYIHPQFIGRLIAIPAAYGFVALLLVISALRQQRGQSYDG